jgi:hypothetical protein
LLHWWSFTFLLFKHKTTCWGLSWQKMKANFYYTGVETKHAKSSEKNWLPKWKSKMDNTLYMYVEYLEPMQSFIFCALNQNKKKTLSNFYWYVQLCKNKLNTYTLYMFVHSNCTYYSSASRSMFLSLYACFDNEQ